MRIKRSSLELTSNDMESRQDVISDTTDMLA